MRIIAGTFRSRTLRAPRGADTRPTTDRARESLFNVLANGVSFEDARVLDLFAGSGALAFEAMSRGARDATLIEKGRPAVMTAKENAEMLDVENRIEILQLDAFRFLEQTNHDTFDLIFADPPYDHPRMNEIAPYIFSGDWLAKGGILTIEHRSSDAIVIPVQATLLRELKAGEAGFTLLRHKAEETAAS